MFSSTPNVSSQKSIGIHKAIMISNIAVALLGVIVGTYIFLRALLHLTHDAREPKAVENAIPFISPILSMAAKKADFYNQMRWAPKHALA